MANIPMTPERVAEINKAVEAGWRRIDIKQKLHVSDRALQKLGIRTTGHKQSPRPGDKRISRVPPERGDDVRRLSGQGLSEAQIAKTLGISCRQVRRTKDQHGIKAMPLSERPKKPKAAKPKKAEKPKGRNPMHHLTAWKPPGANTSLDVLVQKLRTKYCPVCAEDTIRYPHRPPKAYTDATRFRVGELRDVTADQLVTL